jgi:hypothetical protein
MDDRMCNLFEVCQTPEAPLCPLQSKTVKHGIWYGNEAICRAKQFENVPWIKKQYLIAGLRLKMDDGFFTVRMLNSLKVIEKGLKGADPNDRNPEARWFKQRGGIKKDASPKKNNQKASESVQPPLKLF